MQEQGKSESEGRKNVTQKKTILMRFVCPNCGSRDLRMEELDPCNQVSTLDSIEISAATLEFAELHHRENSLEWMGAGDHDGWDFSCRKCGLVPDLEPYEDLDYPEGQLARWFLANCPKTDDGFPGIENCQRED